MIRNILPQLGARTVRLHLEALESRAMLSGASIGDTVGAMVQATDFLGVKHSWFLRNDNSPGEADQTISSRGEYPAGIVPLSGRWNDQHPYDRVGGYREPEGKFYLARHHSGNSTFFVYYGPAGQGWMPVTGDWNGNDFDTVGVWDPANSMFYLRNSNTPGSAEIEFGFGPSNSGWTPLAGDWNGDGVDTVGLFNPATSTFYLRNSHSGGEADHVYDFGPAGAGWKPLAGDFDGDGVDTVGLYDPATATFYLRNSHGGGIADLAFPFGPPNQGWKPLIGDWDRPEAQRAAGGEITPGADVQALTLDELSTVVDVAVAQWASTGLDSSLVAQLSNVSFRVADLPGDLLGLHSPGSVVIDVDAAGYGWHTGTSEPEDDARMDLLSTVMHELGHELGLRDVDADENPGSVMSGTLEAGQRLLPSPEVLDAIYATLG